MTSQPFDRKVPMIIGCALFMELLDSTAVLTALARIAEEFGESSVHMNLIVTVYLLAAAMFIPVSGWLADRCGPRRVFIAAIGLFMAGSLACALSTSLLQLTLARFLQGTAGAMMVPVGQVILLRWSSRDNLLSAMAFLTIPALLGPVVGPPLGGLLVTSLSWHWIFLVNLPIGLLGIGLILRFIPEYPRLENGRLDIVGFLLSGTGLACLVLAFESIGRGTLAWPWLCGLLLLGLLCSALYVRHARRTANPLIDLSLLNMPTFAIVFWGGGLFRLGSASLPFLLVLLFQVGFGLSALEAGLLTFAGGAGALLIKFISVPLVHRFGFRRILLANAILGGASLVVCALLRADTPYVLTLLVLFGGGLSRSLQMSTIGGLTFADIPEESASQASTLSAVSVQLSMSLAVGVAAVLLSLLLALRGHSEITIGDLGITLLLSGLLCASSCLIFRRLEASSGEALACRPE